MAKDIIVHDEARTKLKAGMDKVANAVRVTIGPRGRNVALDKGYGTPVITNDGVSIAKDIELSDTFENMGASIIKEVASKTNDAAGDGTTTATVLTHAIVTEGMKTIAMGANPMSVKAGIEQASVAVRDALSDMAQDIKNSEEIAHVASVSAESNEMGAIIAETIEKVGSDGVVTVEESQTLGIESDVVEGLEFDKGYVSPYMVTDTERMEAVAKDVSILVTDKKITTVKEILPLLEQFAQTGAKDLVIIAEDISGEALTTFVLNKIRGAMNIVGIKAPGFGDDKKDQLQDIATTVGASVVVDDLGMKFEDLTLDVLGKAGRVVATKDKTTIVDGKGDKQTIADRVGQLKAQSDQSDSKYTKEKFQKRISKLSGGVAVLRVGAATEAEMKYLKDKIEDAVNATRAAIAEGIVSGGGSALLKASSIARENMPSDMTDEEKAGYEIVLRALQAPIRQIATNAGQDDGVIVSKVLEAGDHAGYDAKNNRVVENMIQSGIIDPVLVTKSGVLNAASSASVFLTTEVAIADIPEKEEPSIPGGMGGGMGMPGMM